MKNIMSRRKLEWRRINTEIGIKYCLNVVAVLSVTLGFMVATTVAFAQPSPGKWGQQVFSQAKAAPLSKSASVEELCPATPDFSFTVPDPTGDTFGFRVSTA